MLTSLTYDTNRKLSLLSKRLSPSFICCIILLAMNFFLPASVGPVSRWYVKIILLGLWAQFFLKESPSRSRLIVLELRNRTKELGLMYIWLLVLVINLAFPRGDSGFNTNLLIAYVTAFSYYTMGLAYSVDDPAGKRAFTIALLCSIGAAAMMALPILWAEPGISREVQQNAAIQESYLLRGVGPVQTYMCYGLLLPFLAGAIYSIKHPAKWVCLTMLMAIIIACLIASYAGVLFLLTAGLLLFVIIRGGFWTTDLVALSLRGFSVLILVIAAFWMLKSLQNTPFAWVSDKMLNIVTGVTKQGVVEGDESGRGQLMQISLNSIANSPLIGAGFGRFGKGDTAGGHSAWVDSVAFFGIIGTLPLFAFLCLVLMRFIRCRLRGLDRYMTTGALVTWLLFLFYGFANPVTEPQALYAMLLLAGFGGSSLSLPIRTRTRSQ